MTEIVPVAGVSLPPWVPDEALLAYNLNLRISRYGGAYTQDIMALSQNDPSFTELSGGLTYNSGTYGFMMYGGTASNILEDAIVSSDPSLSFISAVDVSVYESGIVYGFASYQGSYQTSEFEATDSTPSLSDLTSEYAYGDSGEYALMQYGSTNPTEDSLVSSDATPTFLSNVLTVNTYGTSRKRGFCVYLP